ncbi:MAG: RNA 2',3'-cyclic phosphodiesterase [Candidatus Nanoarchaeia archaeon]
MRAFIAVEIPEEHKEKIKQIQKQFSNLGNINIVKEYHCTLKFLGDITEKQAEQIKEKLKKIKMKKFEATLEGLGAFPNEGYIRVIWIGIKGRINELQQKIDSELADMFPKDTRFKAHLTLGRVKSIRDKNAMKEKLKLKFNGMCFEVKEFKLIKSTLTPKGPIYETIEVYPLE